MVGLLRTQFAIWFLVVIIHSNNCKDYFVQAVVSKTSTHNNNNVAFVIHPRQQQRSQSYSHIHKSALAKTKPNHIPDSLSFATKPTPPPLGNNKNNKKNRNNNATLSEQSVLNSNKNPRTNSPTRRKDSPEVAVNHNQQHQSQVQIRLQEMHDRNKNGEHLTQEYCDSVLGLCVASDEWEDVLDVLDIMKKHNLSQERSTYVSCLQYCFDYGNGAAAEQILQAMGHALIPPTSTEISLVIGAMCRNNNNKNKNINNSSSDSNNNGNTIIWWRRALKLARTFASSDSNILIPVETYDAIFACIVEDKQWKEALRLLHEMQQGSKTTTTDSKTPTHPKPSLSTYREVVECCVAAEQAEQAVQVLLSMTDQGIVPTVYTFDLVISALSRKLQWRRAIQVLDIMEKLNVTKSIITYNTIISSCAKAREVNMAKHLLFKMKKKDNIKPNVITYNSLISACANTNRWKDAMSLFSECLREPGVSPDIYTYTNAMRACAKGGQTQRALSLLQVVKDKGLPIDGYCYTAAIEACAKAKMWTKALDLLAEMERKNIEPSEVTYSVTISACGNAGQWEKALDLLDVMRQKGMKINLIAYNNAITALSRAAKQTARRYKFQVNSEQEQAIAEQDNSDDTEVEGGEYLWTRVMDLLDQMKEDGISPDGFTFSSAISCCGAEGRWREALGLIDLMKRSGPRTRPNKIAYTAAISACGRSGEHEQALQLFRDMKDEGLSADRVAYNALFSALRVSSKTDLAYELWGEMCGIRSNTGTTAAIATAKVDQRTTPDIITVTDVIAVLSRSERSKDIERVDSVFAEAVRRGIVLQSGGLDSNFEVDLSGMSFPVARAACRYVIKNIVSTMAKSDDDLPSDLTFITGVGRVQNRRVGSEDASTDVLPLGSSEKATTLRDYVKEILLVEFEGPIESFVPERAQGTVEVKKKDLERWIRQYGKSTK